MPTPFKQRKDDFRRATDEYTEQADLLASAAEAALAAGAVVDGDLKRFLRERLAAFRKAQAGIPQ